jgi:hypothetical protein
MKSKTAKGEKLMRIKVTTTLRGDLWQALQIECIKRKCDANDILEELIAEHLKKPKKGGE